MPPLQKVATFVILAGFACIWTFHQLAARALWDAQSDDSLLDSTSLTNAHESLPGSQWIVRRNQAIAFTVIAGLAFGVALNFID